MIYALPSHPALAGHGWAASMGGMGLDNHAR